MSIEKKEIESFGFDINMSGVVILPSNYESEEKYIYPSSTLSFYKYAKSKVDIGCLSNPELLVEQRSGEWFGPVLLFTSQAISENPAIVSITCSVIANYLTEFFKGRSKPKIILQVVHKETNATKLTQIVYTGDADGLGDLKEAILEVAKK